MTHQQQKQQDSPPKASGLKSQTSKAQEQSQNKSLKTAVQQPISPKLLMRLLVAVIIILAFAAAYYQTALKLEKKKYKRLEDKYVRVRNMLGANKMQQLIEDSYQDNQTDSE